MIHPKNPGRESGPGSSPHHQAHLGFVAWGGRREARQMAGRADEEGAGERKGGAEEEVGDSDDEAFDATFVLIDLMSRKLDRSEQGQFDIWKSTDASLKYLAIIEGEVKHWKAQYDQQTRKDYEQKTANLVAAKEKAEKRAAELEELLRAAEHDRDEARRQAQANFTDAVESPALAMAEQQVQTARTRLHEREEVAQQEIEEWEAAHSTEQMAAEIEEAKQEAERCMAKGTEDAEEHFTEHAEAIRAGRLQEAPASSPPYVRSLVTKAIAAVATLREAKQKVPEREEELSRLRAKHEAVLDDLRRELAMAKKYRDTVFERPERDTRFALHLLEQRVEQLMGQRMDQCFERLEQVVRAVELDRVGLVAFYNATGGPNWKVQWDLSAPMESWHGVTIDPDSKRLVELELHGNRIRGALPPEVGHWTALRRLQLYNALGTAEEDKNKLTALPAEVGNWTAMRVLGFNNNQLTALPAGVGNWTAMTNLNLLNNQLTMLPAEVSNWTAMAFLNLNGNRLTTLPAEVGNWTAMADLYLSDSQLRTLPPEVSKWTSMINLSLTNNQLTALPAEVCNWTAMKTLALNNNQLTTLPEKVGNWTTMTILNLNDNQQLATLPAEVSNWATMTELYLNNNELTTLPAEVGHWTALKTLALCGSQLTPLPEAVEGLKQTGCNVIM